MSEKNFKQFIFENFNFDEKSKTLFLKYSLDGEIFFEEKICFDFEFDEDSPLSPLDLRGAETVSDQRGDIKKDSSQPQYNAENILTNAFFGLWVMAGISYFKTYLPKEIVFKNHEISEEQIKFFEKVYFHGLGEFFAVNNINPHGKINFVKNNFKNNLPLSPLNLRGAETVIDQRGDIKKGQDNSELNLSENILLIGGGKDSLTSSALLSESGEKYSTLTVDSDEKFEAQIKIINPEEHLKVSRTICPNLLRILKEKDLPSSPLNLRGAETIPSQWGDIQKDKKISPPPAKLGTPLNLRGEKVELPKIKPLNGHVPISAIWAFLSVCVGILKGKKNIILSNEHSANEATMEFYGEKINHQYSKTLEFEKDFQNYIQSFISPEIKYFSLLRPLTELYIAEIFAEKCWNKFEQNFSSCNRNFKISNQKNKFSWCGKCPKCAFVFTIFAPFIKKEKLIKIFNEKNLFEDKNLEETFFELLGLREQKPFECVGEIQEVRQAMYMALENFPEVQKFTDYFKNPEKFNYKKLHNHSMPEVFYEKIFMNL